MEYILASASPRRSEILTSLGLKFKILKSNVEADKDFKANCLNKNFAEYVMNLSKLKAEDVANQLDTEKETVIISADTIVVYNEKIFEKPENENEAFYILKNLSGNVHNVLTGITVIKLPEYKIISDFESTEVLFGNLTDQEIYEYIKTGEPMDKAGAYGIQGKGSLLVKSIKGCYFNVVGLPVNKLKNILAEFNINLLLSNA